MAREPVTDPEAWVTVSWDNGGSEPFTIQVHPEEVFTGEQAAPVFRAYIENETLPPSRAATPNRRLTRRKSANGAAPTIPQGRSILPASPGILPLPHG